MISYSNWGNELYSGKRSYGIVPNRRIFIGIGLTMILLSAIALVFPGLNPSIEFEGGTEFTVSEVASSDPAPARDVVSQIKETKGAQVTTIGLESTSTRGIRVKTQQLTTPVQRDVAAKLAAAYKVDKNNVNVSVIGPSWGSQVSTKAVQSLFTFLALVAIVMAIYFRTWTMSVAALFALMHDVLITGGVLALTRVEISPATVIGLLTILGYSLYDTVVVFDKVRELTTDFTEQRRYTYAELVNLSVNQTMVRSINTSIVALVPVTAILMMASFVLGGGTLRDISLSLFVGMIVGTFSSIFIASPLLVILRQREAGVKKHNEQVFARRRAAHDSNTDTQVADEDLEVVAPLVAGHHRGQEAQPKRKPRSKR